MEDEGWIKEYRVDSRKCHLVSSRITPKEGGEFYQIEFGNFAGSSASGGISNSQMELPRVVRIKSPTKDYAQIRFLERKIDFNVPQNKFDLRIPPEAKRVNFEPRNGEP